MTIQRLHWDELGPAVRPAWVPTSGRMGVLWPSPVDHDQCFTAAGFTKFADSTPAWEADFATLVSRVVGYFSNWGMASLAAGEAPPLRFATPSPLVAALVAPSRDDGFPECEVRFGVPAAARVRTGAGHPLVWVWAAALEQEAFVAEVARSWPVSRRALQWEHLVQRHVQACDLTCVAPAGRCMRQVSRVGTTRLQFSITVPAASSAAGELGRQAAPTHSLAEAVDHYTKLAVLGMRIFGMFALLYAVPIIIWGVLRFGMGPLSAEEAREQVSSIGGWVMYAFAGGFLYLFAGPLARVAARGLARTDATPPAA